MRVQTRDRREDQPLGTEVPNESGLQQRLSAKGDPPHSSCVTDEDFFF